MIEELIDIIKNRYKENKITGLMPVPFLILLMYFFVTEPKLSFVLLLIISGIGSLMLFVKWIFDVQDDYVERRRD